MKKIPLSAVLWIPVLLLTLGLLSVEVIYIYNARQNLKQLSGIQHSSQVIRQISSLIHELQIERGRGVLFLERQITLQVLSDQRQRVDQAIEKLSDESKNDQTQISSIVQWNEIRSQIKQLRYQVEDYKISPEQNLTEFSDVINKLLNQQMIAAEAYHYRGLASSLNKIIILEKVKDNLGILRAMMSEAAAKNKPIVRRTALDLNEHFVGIKTNTEFLGLSQIAHAKRGMLRILASQDWLKITEAYDKIISTKKGPLNLDSQEVFASVTTVVEAVNKLMNQEFERSDKALATEYNWVKESFYVICFIFMITTLLAVLITVYTTRYLIRSVQSLVLLSEKISTESYSGEAAELNNLVSRELFFLGSKMDEMGKSLGSAMDHLRKSNESLEQYAFVTSHDLQEPVKKISSYIEFIEMSIDDRLSDSDREFIEKIKSSCQRMIDLISAMLGFSRLSNEEMAFDQVDLSQILGQVIDSMSEEIHQAGVEIKQSALPNIRGNKELLQSVFQNLLSNSIKYRKKDVTLRVEVSSQSSGTNGWKILFQDNGIGFDMKQASVLFKPFGRIHPKDLYPGSGIGLAAIKRIMDIHHAKIEVHSEKDIGTSFTLSFI